MRVRTYLFTVLFLSLNLANAEEKATFADSVLWKISGKGLEKPSYVFAKWHFLCRNEIIFKHKVKIAIHETEQLIIQNHMHYVTDEDYYARQKTLEKMNRGQPIHKIKDRKKRKTLLKLIKTHFDLKYDPVKRIKYLVKRMTPLDTFLASTHSFIDGCYRLGSFDRQLFSHYKKKEANIGSVDSVSSFYENWMQSGVMSVDSLIAYLSDFEQQKELIYKMKHAYYIDEDLALVNQLYLDFLTNSATNTEQIKSHLLQTKTHAWLDTIRYAIHSKPTFISVNASYLIGEDGLLSQLQSNGYEVEPVK